MTLTSLRRDKYESITYVSVAPWVDGQPNLEFQVNYTVDQSDPRWADINIYWYGKPAGDSRGYPFQAYWLKQQLFSDHRTEPASWIYSTFDHAHFSIGVWCSGNKYFLCTEDLVAMRLIEEPRRSAIEKWAKRQ